MPGVTIVRRLPAATKGREPTRAELAKVMRGLPARAGHRQRRGRRPHQAAPGPAQPVLLLRWLWVGLHRPWRAHQGRDQASVGRLRRLGHPRPGVRRRGHPPRRGCGPCRGDPVRRGGQPPLHRRVAARRRRRPRGRLARGRAPAL